MILASADGEPRITTLDRYKNHFYAIILHHVGNVKLQRTPSPKHGHLRSRMQEFCILVAMYLLAEGNLYTR